MPSRIETLSQAGFSSEEIQEYIARKRVLFRENGFSDSEVDAYFGIAPKLEDVDTEPFRKSFRERFAAFRAAAIKAGPGEMSQPEPDLSDVEIEVPFKDAVEIGLGGSVTGLLAREKPPRMLPEDASRAERIVAQAAGLAGDFPFMVAGAAIGAGSGPLALVTGTAAAFALPAGLRRVLVETYQNGQIDSFGRFWDVLSATLLDEMKGYATGAAVGATVGVARAAALPAAAAFPIELTTLVKVGAALDGREPEPWEFAEAAVVLGGLKAAPRVSHFLIKRGHELYAAKNIRPRDVKEAAKTDPTIVEDLHSANIDTPRSFKGPGDPPLKQKVSPPEPKPVKAKKHSDPDVAAILERTSIGEKAPRNVDRTLHGLYNDVKDRLHHLGRAVNAMAEGKPLDVVEDAYKLARLEVGAVGKANHFLDYRPFDYKTLKPTGKGLRQILAPRRTVREVLKGVPKPAKVNLDEVRALLLARRTLELEPRGIETGMPLDAARNVVAKYGPKLGKVADELVQYQDAPLRYLRDSGVLSERSYNLMKEANKDYIPFFRVMEEGMEGAGTGKTLARISQPIHRIKGSELKVVDPLESIIKNTYVLIAQAEKNRVARAYVDLVEKHQGGPVPVLTRDTASALKKAQQGKGFTVRVLRGAGSEADLKASGDDAMFGNARYYTGNQRAAEVYASFRPGKPKVEKATITLRKPFTDEIFATDAEMAAGGPKLYRQKEYRNLKNLLVGEGMPEAMAERLFNPHRSRGVFEEGRKFLAKKYGDRGTWAGAERMRALVEKAGFDGIVGRLSDMMEMPAHEQIAAFPAAMKTTESPYGKRIKAPRVPLKLSSREIDKLFELYRSGKAKDISPEVEARLKQVLEHEFAIFRPRSIVASRGEIQVWRNGKVEVWKVPQDVWESFSSMDPALGSIMVQILSKPARLLRAGAVLSPEFIARNPIRDNLTAYLYSENGFKPFLDVMRGLFSVARKDDLYQEWLRSGGPMAALVSLDRQYLQQNIRELARSGSFSGKVRNVITSPIDGLRLFSMFMEEATRVGEFKAARKRGKSIMQAGFDSREVTLDFGRIGAKTQSVNAVVAFFNAQVEGADKMAREFRDHPARTTAKVVGSITVPSVALYLLNRDEDGWSEIPQWQKDLFWLVPVRSDVADDLLGHIPGVSISRQGNTWFRIPKPFEIGILFGSVPERIAEWILDNDPDAFADTMKTLMFGLTPSVIPTAAIPVAETYFNKSIFLDRPIIPQRLEGLLPEYQGQPYTTELTKAIGHAIADVPGLSRSRISSPLILDNFVRAWTGGLGVHILNLGDAALRKAGVLPDPVKPADTLSDVPFIKGFTVRFPTASAESIQDFYKRYNENKQIIETFKALAKQGDGDAALRLQEDFGVGNFVDLSDVSEALGNLSEAIRMVASHPTISPEEKRQTIDGMYLSMIEIAKAGNQVFDALEKKGLRK